MHWKQNKSATKEQKVGLLNDLKRDRRETSDIFPHLPTIDMANSQNIQRIPAV
ncbi:MAG: hypothetical protein H7318_10750 [Oligoflexus sp.]|nr:hypothetical protein [Oligoflexus sp.]